MTTGAATHRAASCKIYRERERERKGDREIEREREREKALGRSRRSQEGGIDLGEAKRRSFPAVYRSPRRKVGIPYQDLYLYSERGLVRPTVGWAMAECAPRSRERESIDGIRNAFGGCSSSAAQKMCATIDAAKKQDRGQ